MKSYIKFFEYKKQIILVVFIIIVLFFVGKLLTEKFIHISGVISQEIITSPSILIQKPVVSSVAEPKQFHITAVKYGKQADKALLLYRTNESKEDVIWFYTHITGNQKISSIILEYANQNNIPPSLAFALAWEESRYQPRAVNNNISSIDRGLFQLNNKSFPYLKEKEFFDPEISAQYGLQHLSFCLETAGNEISALAMYNAGTNKVRNNNTPQRTLDYVSRILAYKKGLEDIFEEEIFNRYYIEKENNNVISVALLD